MIYKKPLKENLLINTGRPTKKQLGASFSLCVWNFQKCKNKKWTDDFAALASDTDIFLGQEIRIHKKVEAALIKTPLYWSSAVSFYSLYKKLATGITIGSLAKPLHLEIIAPVKEPFVKVPKMTMSAVFDIAGTEMLVINVHAINFKGIKAFEENLRQAKNLLKLFKGPIIIAGDFNTWSKRRLLAAKTLIQSLHMREVKFTPDNRARFFKHPVDYIFTRGLKLQKAWIPITKSSDHNPMRAIFTLDTQKQ
ncbi:MAG: endonuclease/exonuclease/phosphatase family protein [Elusimicrobiota bacterium]|jgi:endonuclease/exonuclease/phosphatase (EEP) superfamily protein YafD|nr:endonuclease/exonuclease/phosphatase family protein [Elusimicrobiota bacterium]